MVGLVASSWSGQPDPRTRVEGVDGHLRVGRPGDLDAAVVETGTGTGDAPVAVLADVCRVFAEARVVPVADLEAAAHPVGQPVVTAGGEPVVQLGEEAMASGVRISRSGRAWVQVTFDRPDTCWVVWIGAVVGGAGGNWS